MFLVNYSDQVYLHSNLQESHKNVNINFAWYCLKVDVEKTKKN
jgi:hypothetical protein